MSLTIPVEVGHPRPATEHRSRAEDQIRHLMQMHLRSILLCKCLKEEIFNYKHKNVATMLVKIGLEDFSVSLETLYNTA